MPSVLNKYKDQCPPDAVYIGRPSKWGNPFSHMSGTRAAFRVKDRDEAVSKFLEWILEQPELLEQVKRELKGRDLVCFCAPKLCHGHVLEYLANN